jgi:hypothetical protein
VIQNDEKDLIDPILNAFKNGQESVYLRDFTDFEWDQVCHVDYPSSGMYTPTDFIKTEVDESYNIWIKKIPDALKDPDYSPYRAAFVFIKDRKIIKVIAIKGVWIYNYDNVPKYNKDGQFILNKLDADGCTSSSFTKLSPYGSLKKFDGILITAEEDK